MARHVPVTARVTGLEAEMLDRVRGRLSRSSFLRMALLAAISDCDSNPPEVISDSDSDSRK